MFSAQDARFSGGVNELTIITTVKPGRPPGAVFTYLQQLQTVLDSVRDRETSGVPTPIRLVSTIHFARWILWNDGDTNKLIFTSNYDGSMWQYLRDFSSLIAEDMDRVWGNCVGYPEGGCRDFDAFWDYVKQHQVETDCFFAALPGESLRQREALIEFKRAFDRFVAQQLAVGGQDTDNFYRQFCLFLKQNQFY